MTKFDDGIFTSLADEIMTGGEGTADVQEFIERWFEWNLGDPSWADQLWEMLSYPPEQRAELMASWS